MIIQTNQIIPHTTPALSNTLLQDGKYLRGKKRPAPHRHCLPRDKIQGKEDAGPGEGDQKPVTWRANFAKLMAQCPVTICYAGA